MNKYMLNMLNECYLMRYYVWHHFWFNLLFFDFIIFLRGVSLIYYKLRVG